MPLPLSPQVFPILAGLVEERLGLRFEVADRELFAEKVSVRAIERGFDSLLDYYYYLRYDPGGAEELEALAEVLVVGETFFFRHEEQLVVLVDEVLAPRARAGGALRVWSAACATGEEPLSLAMLLEERGLLDRVEIVGSDLSRGALARARSGRFAARSVRHQPASLDLERYLRRTPEGTYELDERLGRAVTWRRLNLLDAEAAAELGRFDAVLCRNVLIYFSEATTARVVATLVAALRPGGVLMVGLSESLLRHAGGLEWQEVGGVFLYRRVEEA